MLLCFVNWIETWKKWRKNSTTTRPWSQSFRLQMENAIFNLNTNCKLINSSVQKMMNSMGGSQTRKLIELCEFLVWIEPGISKKPKIEHMFSKHWLKCLLLCIRKRQFKSLFFNCSWNFHIFKQPRSNEFTKWAPNFLCDSQINSHSKTSFYNRHNL